MTQTTTIVICILMTLFGISCALQHSQQIDANRTEIGSKVLSRKKRFLIFPTGSSFSVAVCMTVGVYGNPQFSIWSWAVNYGFAYNLPSNSSEFLHAPHRVQIYPFIDPDYEEPKDEETTTTTTTTDAAIHSDHSHESISHDSHESISHDSHESISHDDNGMTKRRQFYVYSHPKYETMPMMQRRYRRDIYRNVEAVIDKMGYSGHGCVLLALCESSQIFDRKRRTMVQELLRTVFTLPKSKVLPFEHADLFSYDKAFRDGQNKVNCRRTYAECGFSVIKMILGKYSKPHVGYM